MATPIHQTQSPPPNKEDLKKEEMRKEEQEKRLLEQELMEFDAHAFYEKLLAWSQKPLPKPYKRLLHVSLFRVREVMWQPLPVSRSDSRELLHLSKTMGKILSLLRQVDQKGLECPYVHQVNKWILEKALEKCELMKQACQKYLKTKGVFARLSQLLHRSHILWAIKDIESFKRRLESIVVMCRHQEFTQDLMRLRREVTFRTGNILKDDLPVEVPVKPKPEKSGKPSPNGVSFFQPAGKMTMKGPHAPVETQKREQNTASKK